MPFSPLARLFTYLGVSLLLANALAALLFLVAHALGRRSSAAPGSLPSMLELLASMVVVAPVIAAWTAWMQRRHGQTLADLGFTLPPPVGRFFRGWAIGLGITGLFLLVGLASGSLAWASADSVTLATRWGALGGGVVALALAAGFVLQGGLEELMLRGYVQHTVEEWRAHSENRASARGWVLVVPAAIFALFHGLNPGFTPLALFNTFAIGLVFSEWVLRARSLWDVIGVHAGWNFGLAVLWSLPVSGFQTLHLLPIVSREARTSVWLTGGGYGPEAGVACTLITIAGWFAVRKFVQPTTEPTTQPRG